MATTSICNVDGCDKVIRAHGYCSGHLYRKNRYGDPLAGRAFYGEPQRFLKEQAFCFSGEECLFWPFGRISNGYPVVHIDGKAQFAHRIVCENAHGSPSGDTPEAAHSCGNGHLGCVNPKHLLWKSRKGNMEDMVLHGRSNRGSRHWQNKLSEDDVRKIRTLASTNSTAALSRMFEVNRRTISDILSGRNWSWLE